MDLNKRKINYHTHSHASKMTYCGRSLAELFFVKFQQFSRIRLIALSFQLFIAFTERKKKVPFSMAIGNGQPLQECFPKNLLMGTARMK